MVQKLNNIHKTTKYIFKLLLYSVFFCILSFGKVLCQSNINLNLFVGVGTYFAFLNKGFLKEYKNTLGGKKEDFLHQFALGTALLVNWNKDYSVGLSTTLIKLSIQDNFSKEIYEGSGTYRLYFEDIKVTTIPICISSKLTDYTQKYRSFIQLGIGMAYSKVEWNESVISPIPNDIRIGGKLINEVNYYPTILTSFGVELFFDKGSVPNFISGINLSTDFVYLARYIKIFEKLIKQHFIKYPAFNESHSVVPVIIGFNIGLILNIDNKKINRVFGSNI